jgi:hypothetical protein
MPRVEKRLRIVALVLATPLVLVLLLVIFNDDQPSPKTAEPPPTVIVLPPAQDPAASVPTSAAVSYAIVSVEDTSMPNRKRARAIITAPEARTADQRAQTALKAALELRAPTKATHIFVQLMLDGTSTSAGWAAEASFASDGWDHAAIEKLQNGTWEAKVSSTSGKLVDYGAP